MYGELLDAAHGLPEQLDRFGPATRRFLADLADTAAARWQEEDHAIWEIDRAITLAGRLDALDRVDRWKATRDGSPTRS